MLTRWITTLVNQVVISYDGSLVATGTEFG